MKKIFLIICFFVITLSLNGCKQIKVEDEQQEAEVQIIEKHDVTLGTLCCPLYNIAMSSISPIEYQIKTNIDYTSVSVISDFGYVGYEKSEKEKITWNKGKTENIEKTEVFDNRIYWHDSSVLGYNYTLDKDAYFCIILKNSDVIVASVIIRIKVSKDESRIHGYSASILFSSIYPKIEGKDQNVTEEIILNKINDYIKYNDEIGKFGLASLYVIDNYWRGICYGINENIDYDTLDITCSKGYVGYMVSEDTEEDYREYSFKELEYTNIKKEDMCSKYLFWTPIKDLDRYYQNEEKFPNVIFTITLKKQNKVIGDVYISIYSDYYYSSSFYSHLISSTLYK